MPHPLAHPYHAFDARTGSGAGTELLHCLMPAGEASYVGIINKGLFPCTMSPPYAARAA